MPKHLSLSTSSVILSGIPHTPFHLEPKYDFKESAYAQRWSRGWGGRGMERNNQKRWQALTFPTLLTPTVATAV